MIAVTAGELWNKLYLSLPDDEDFPEREEELLLDELAGNLGRELKDLSASTLQRAKAICDKWSLVAEAEELQRVIAEKAE